MADTTKHKLTDNELPNAVEAEKVVLGGILLDNSLIRQTLKLNVFDFYSPRHQMIFGAMLELAETGEPIDPVFIGKILEREGAKESIGGVASIANLSYGLPYFRTLSPYVNKIKQAALYRRSVKQLESLQIQVYSQKISIKDFCTSLAALETELRSGFASETDSFQKLSEVMNTEVVPTLEAYFKREVSEFLISSGFPAIDDVLGGGFYLSDMVAIVAPPKSAKSALALQLTLNFAEQEETVGLLSLEMSNLQNGLRFIAQKSYLDSRKQTQTLQTAVSSNFLRPGIYESTYKKALQTAASLYENNIYICQKPLTWQEIKAETRRLVKEKNLRVLIVDYWQLVQNTNDRKTRAENLGEIAKGLKALGQELNILVITLGQFNQAGLRRWKQTGVLSAEDIEGSGELVKSANIVITVDIEEGDFNNRQAPRVGTLTFKPLRSAADAKLDVMFFGEYLTLEIS